MSDVKSNELGFVGNVWVRQNVLEKAGQSNQDHKHKFDHVSLLTTGKVAVEVEGYPVKEFTAPTFIVIKKGHSHKFTALEDHTIWYCVFAMRDIDGNVTDIYGPDNSPYGVSSDDYSDKKQILESM